MRHSAVVILMALVLAGGAASADPIGSITVKWHPPNFTSGTIFLWGAGYKGAEAYGGIDPLEVAATPPPSGEGTALLRNPQTGFLDAFCIELLQGPPSSFATYAVVMPEDAPDPGEYVPGAMGYEKQEHLRELWGRYFGAARLDGLKAEVFSACVWEIVYEDNETVWDVTTIGSPDGRGFRCTGTDTTLANAWLASLDGEGPKANLRALTHPDHQDFLVETPEPATLWLLVTGGATALIGAVRRRRRR